MNTPSNARPQQQVINMINLMKEKLNAMTVFDQQESQTLEEMVEYLRYLSTKQEKINGLAYLLDPKAIMMPIPDEEQGEADGKRPKVFQQLLAKDGLAKLYAGPSDTLVAELLARKRQLVKGLYPGGQHGPEAFDEPNSDENLDPKLCQAYRNFLYVKYKNGPRNRQATIATKCQVMYEAYRMGRYIKSGFGANLGEKEKIAIAMKLKGGPVNKRDHEIVTLAIRMEEMCTELGEFCCLIPDILTETKIYRLSNVDYATIKQGIRQYMPKDSMISRVIIYGTETEAINTTPSIATDMAIYDYEYDYNHLNFWNSGYLNKPKTQR